MVIVSGVEPRWNLIRINPFVQSVIQYGQNILIQIILKNIVIFVVKSLNRLIQNQFVILYINK